MDNGSDVFLLIGTKVITGETSSSLSLVTDMIETTHKHTTGKSKTYIAGEDGGTVSVSGCCDPTNATDYGFSDAYAALKAKVAIAFKIGKTGGEYIGGNALISSLTRDNPQNDRSTFSLELQITGGHEEGACMTA